MHDIVRVTAGRYKPACFGHRYAYATARKNVPGKLGVFLLDQLYHLGIALYGIYGACSMILGLQNIRTTTGAEDAYPGALAQMIGESRSDTG